MKYSERKQGINLARTYRNSKLLRLKRANREPLRYAMAVRFGSSITRLGRCGETHCAGFFKIIIRQDSRALKSGEIIQTVLNNI